MHIVCATLALQSLLSFQVEGAGPVRFGVPLRIDAVESGLRLHGPPGAALQWRFQQTTPGVRADRVWVELAVVGAKPGTRSARFRLLAGGDGPTDFEDPQAAAVCRTARRRIGDPDRGDGAEEEIRTWTWRDGTVDTRRVRPAEGEPGILEAIDGPGLSGRLLRVRIGERFWREAGVLPRRDGSGTALRRDLLAGLPRLAECEAAGVRGRGDYLRGETVTNLEFDTGLALLRLGLAEGSREALGRGVRAAEHLVHVDLERRSGLPHRHGPRHRSHAPEPGHIWIEGLRLAALLGADEELLAAARTMARTLAARVRRGSGGDGYRDRLRDEAWPLHELEGHLAFEDSEPVRIACDRLAARVMARWDAGFGALRYGEGESRSGATYDQRLWIELGIAATALSRHAARTDHAQARRIVERLRERAVALWRRGRAGLPIRCRVTAGGDVVSVQRVRGVAEPVLLLEGLGRVSRARLLRRSGVAVALEGILDPTAEDFATRFTLLGRCRWVMQ